MIVVEIKVNSSIQKVWEAFTEPSHIVNWYFASADWHCPKAENNLTVGGMFKTTMASKDGKFGFDFEGKYISLTANKLIEYEIIDGRKVLITFAENNNIVTLKEAFDPESENSHELQQSGWQAILNNFKKYVEQY